MLSTFCILRPMVILPQKKVVKTKLLFSQEVHFYDYKQV
jgi:hypothetical protein